MNACKANQCPLQARKHCIHHPSLPVLRNHPFQFSNALPLSNDNGQFAERTIQVSRLQNFGRIQFLHWLGSTGLLLAWTSVKYHEADFSHFYSCQCTVPNKQPFPPPRTPSHIWHEETSWCFGPTCDCGQILSTPWSMIHRPSPMSTSALHCTPPSCLTSVRLSCPIDVVAKLALEVPKDDV